MFFLLVFGLIFFPFFVIKAAGLVPCGGPGERVCEACDILVLADNIIKFALRIAFLISIGCIIYGGYRWIFSFGNPSNVTAGWQFIYSALIGLLIILASWIIVNTFFWLIAEFFGGWDYTSNWFKIECSP